MRKAGWIFVTFAAMYLIATIVGFATYLLISPHVMWISVFTLMPIASAALIYGYLRKMQFSRDSSLKETAHLVSCWISFSRGDIHPNRSSCQPRTTRLDILPGSIAMDLVLLCRSFGLGSCGAMYLKNPHA